MNCNPGDMAVIVRMFRKREAWLVGRIVRVMYAESHPLAPERLGWILEEPLPDPADPANPVIGILDSCLLPIRPDGITDEEVRDLYAPKPAERASTRKPVHGGYPTRAMAA